MRSFFRLKRLGNSLIKKPDSLLKKTNSLLRRLDGLLKNSGGLLYGGCLTALLVMSAATPAIADANPNLSTDVNAEPLFELHCAGCHANGGNIIRRGKNLKKRAMDRNGYGEVEAITQIIMQGKGAMTAFADRLSEEEVSAIAQYVHEKAETGW
ncbi:MAG: c-type cytochrome [Cyanobacteria bacterium J06621_11]